MSRTTTTTALFTAALLLAGAAVGCSNSGSGDPDAKSAPSPTVDPGDTFVNSVIDAHFDSYTDGVPAAAELKTFPPKWCKALREGHSVEWMLSVAGGDLYPAGEQWGTAKPDTYQLMVLGVGAYCPKSLPGLKRELRASGQY